MLRRRLVNITTIIRTQELKMMKCFACGFKSLGNDMGFPSLLVSGTSCPVIGNSYLLVEF